MNTPARKGNPLLGISLSILFVALGLHLIFNVAEQTTNATLVKITGAACIIFFGGLLLFSVVKALKKKQP